MVVDPTTLVQIIAAYWPVLVISLVVSLLLTPLCRRFALGRNFVDHPDAWLKTHKDPVPYGGGVAIFAGWCAGLVYALVRFHNARNPAQWPGSAPSIFTTVMMGVLLTGALITLLGLVDDYRSISPRLKLVCSIAVACIVLSCGIGDDVVRIWSRSAQVRFEEHETWLILTYSLPVSIFIIVGACNATNLIDGLDGLCSGVLVIIAAGFLVLAVHMHLHGDGRPRDAQRVILCLAILGSALGFLPFYRHPARIFLGDAGSMLLGLNAAILLLMFADEQRLKWMLGSLMVFGLPLADMVLTLVRRWRAQQPLMAGDRSHFYDQLVDRGLSIRTVVWISYALAALFTVMGVLVIRLRTRHVILLYTAFAMLLAYAVHRFKMVRVDRSTKQSQ